MKFELTRRKLIKIASASSALCACPFSGVTRAFLSPPSSSLFYRDPAGRMWDTWMYYRDETFYLSYLINTLGNPLPKATRDRSSVDMRDYWEDRVNLATSKDGVHWTKYGSVFRAPTDWTIHTNKGWPVISPKKGSYDRFVTLVSLLYTKNLNFTKPLWNRYYAESTDLKKWHVAGDRIEISPVSPDEHGSPRLRIVVRNPSGGYYGYAEPREKYRNGDWGMPVLQSVDGLKWKRVGSAVFRGIKAKTGGELSQITQHRGQYYAVIGLNDLDDAVPEDFSSAMLPGMTTFVSDSPFGPFAPSAKNRRLLCGNNSYFSSFVDTPEGVLVNHHSWVIDPSFLLWTDKNQTWFTPLKRAYWDEDSTLRLRWWEGNNRSKARRILLERPSSAGSPVSFFQHNFEPNRTMILEGSIDLPSSNSEGPIGLYIDGISTSGTAFLLGANARVEYGLIRSDGTEFKREGFVDRELQLSGTAKFRFIRHGRLTEFYINDYLMQSHCLPEARTGRLGVIGDAKLHQVEAWYCA